MKKFYEMNQIKLNKTILKLHAERKISAQNVKLH